MQKRFKKSNDNQQAAVVINSDSEIEEKVKVTDDMFEAAKLMKTGGVTNIKDLDMSLVKHNQSLNIKAGTCEVTLIDIFQEGEIKVEK